MIESGVPSETWEALCEKLNRHFQTTAQSLCMVWVDPAQADPFEAIPLVEERRNRIPIRHPRFDPLRAPYVMPLDLSRSPDADLFRDSVELAWQSWDTEHLSAMRGQPICGWLTTGASAKAVAGHWGRHCHLHLRGRQTKLLRFQDPGVREWLWSDLSDAQQRAMLGPVIEVYAIGRDQSLVHHRCADVKPLSPPHAHGALQLTIAQWEQVEDYAAVHAAWLIWHSTRREAVAGPKPGWERTILGALTQATRLGVCDATDRELFALHALQLGPAFHRNERLQKVWQKTQAGEFYGSAVEEVTGCGADQLDTLINAA